MDVGLDLPIILVDDDFYEYLEEESAGQLIDVNELAIYFHQWMKENCE